MDEFRAALTLYRKYMTSLALKYGLKKTQVTVQVVEAVLSSEVTACAVRCDRTALPR